MAKVKKPSFIAIGVGQGDVFFLERAGLTVLIELADIVKREG